MHRRHVLLCLPLIVGCGDDGPSGGTTTTTTTTMASSTSVDTLPMTETTTTPTADSTTMITPSDTTEGACGMSYDFCSPNGCCDGFTCVSQADKSEVCCEVGDGNCYCACENHEELAPVPEACADLDVPPFDDFTELAGWLEGPSTIRGSSHVPYYCSSVDISEPTGADLECPCTGFINFVQLELPSETFEVGETTATLTEVDASCRDTCDVDGFQSADLAFQILAVSETCVIGETVGSDFDTRVYVDLGACP